MLAGCPSDWQRRDTALEVAALTFTAVDMSQTRDIVRSCDEANPILGRCGENIDYRIYFGAVIVLEMVVARLLPADWRAPFIGAWAGAEGATVWDNWRASTR